MTKTDLLEKLRAIDELTLIDLLGVTSDEIVDAFLDLIEQRTEYLVKQVEA